MSGRRAVAVVSEVGPLDGLVRMSSVAAASAEYDVMRIVTRAAAQSSNVWAAT